jgi:hypothetical protein
MVADIDTVPTNVPVYRYRGVAVLEERPKFAGFLEHIQRYLGTVGSAVPPHLDGHNRGYDLLSVINATGNLVSARP